MKNNSFFDDCDKILKFHYDYFIDGAFNTDGSMKWHDLPTIKEIFKKELPNGKDGYHRAIQYELTNEGYLKSIGELNDLLNKVHHVTPKGYAFVSIGGYKAKIETEKQSLNMNKYNTFNSMLGWVVAFIFGLVQAVQSCGNNEKEQKIKDLESTVAKMKSKSVTDSLKIHKYLIQKPNPKQKPDTLEYSNNR